jgi:hypothetical protein
MVVGYLLTVVLVDVVVTPLALRLTRVVVDPAGVFCVTVLLVAPVLLCVVRTVLELLGATTGFGSEAV